MPWCKECKSKQVKEKWKNRKNFNIWKEDPVG